MSLKETKQEAEAVLDSAEMTLETFPGGGKARRELETKVRELEVELQDAESESKLRGLIKDVRELMDDLEEEGSEDPMEPGMDDDFPPEDEMPPI